MDNSDKFSLLHTHTPLKTQNLNSLGLFQYEQTEETISTEPECIVQRSNAHNEDLEPSKRLKCIQYILFTARSGDIFEFLISKWLKVKYFITFV